MAELSAQSPWQNPSDMPRHIAIIMDGNGRWAKARGLPRAIGHRMGVEAVRRTIKASLDLGLEYLTLYSFSSENWSRPASEVLDLMKLMKRFIKRDLAELHTAGVRLHVIGSRRDVDPELLTLIDEACQLTLGNSELNLVIAFNYGGRDEIVTAVKALASRVASGEITVDSITSADVEEMLTTRDVPDPDLLIRTSGEQRLSNFLLWQSAYTEFVFLDTAWPDFKKEDLAAAIEVFQGRERRFGGLSKQTSA